MKKFIVILAASLAAICSVGAQDLASVTEIYNSGATSLSSNDKAAALKSFEQAYTLATALGDEGKDIASECKNIIPNIYLEIAKDDIKAGNYDSAITKLKSSISAAGKYEAPAVSDEANSLIKQVAMQNGATLFNDKNYAGAAEAYKKVVEADPTNGNAALLLGVSLNAAGKVDEAKAALEQAAANGQADKANKQLSNISLREAANALKDKDYSSAISTSLKSAEYMENSKAYQIAAQASQLKGNNDDAIKYFEKYLEIDPKAKNAGQIAYTVGVLCQQAKNNSKAKEYYTKALSDAKYGAEAKKLLDSLQ